MKEKISEMFQTLWKKIPEGLSFLTEKARALTTRLKRLLKRGADNAPELRKKTLSFALKGWYLAAGLLFFFLVLYYPAGALIIHGIDVDPDFAGEDGGNVRTLGTLEALIRRETETHVFTPNKPFFHPSAFLDDMPAFQTGIVTGVKNVTEAFADADPSSVRLKDAAERLAYPADIWHISKWKPAVSSVKKYKKAQSLLAEYRDEAAKEGKSFDRSGKALSVILARLQKALEKCAEQAEERVAAGSGKTIDSEADDVFYRLKGEAYVYSLALRDLKKDFEPVFADENVGKKWEKTAALLQKAVRIDPSIISNGAPDSRFVPNHLMNVGFYLARAACVAGETGKEMKTDCEEGIKADHEKENNV